MPASNAECDVKQAFDYEKDQQKSVGHITKLIIGGSELAADLELTKPTDFTKHKVVGAVQKLTWDGGHASKISCECYISTPNKQKVAELLHKKLQKTDVIFNFIVWEYDSVATAFYESFVPVSDLKGLLIREDKHLKLELPETTPFSDVPSPEVWKLLFEVRPQNLTQDITLATAHQKNIVKTWGVAVG